MSSGKIRYIFLLLAAVFIYTAQSVLMPYQSFSQDNSKNTSTTNTGQEKIQPFNNMIRNFILLAEEVLTEPKKNPTELTPTSEQKITQQAQTDQSLQTAETKTKEPKVEQEIPSVEELKIPEPTVLPTTSLTSPKEGLVQKFFSMEEKKPEKPVQGKVVTRIIKDQKNTSLNNKNNNTDNTPKPVIKESSEPSPTERPNTNYRIQRLSDAVSKKSYTRDNEHLPKAVYNDEYKTILFDSAATGNLDVLRTMLDNFRDTEVRDAEGNTPLIYAIMAGNIESALTITSMDANINARNDNGVSPLYAATKLGRIDLVKLILSHMANPDINDKNGTTPLMLAAEMDFSSIIYILLEGGATIDKRMKNGNTAMHMAVKNNNIASLNLLITKGADIEIRNFKGYTPLMLAIESGQEKSASLLINAGADITKKNVQGMDISAIARNGGNSSMIELVESEKIRQKLLAHKIMETRKFKVTPKNEDEKDLIPSSIIAKRVGGIPVPSKKPSYPPPAKTPKPLFSKDEIEKMEQPGL